MIEQLNSLTKKEMFEVAKIHQEELPESIIARLGIPFLKFYYSKMLLLDGFYVGVFRYNEKVAGFTSYSTDADAIFKKAIFRFPFSLAASLFKKFFTNPLQLLRCIFFVFFRDMAEPAVKEVLNGVKAEAFTVAVLNNYRSSEFIRKTGLSVAKLLLRDQFKHYQHLNVKRVKAFVSQDNKNAIIFHRLNGYQQVGSCNKFGIPSFGYIKELE